MSFSSSARTSSSSWWQNVAINILPSSDQQLQEQVLGDHDVDVDHVGRLHRKMLQTNHSLTHPKRNAALVLGELVLAEEAMRGARASWASLWGKGAARLAVGVGAASVVSLPRGFSCHAVREKGNFEPP